MASGTPASETNLFLAPFGMVQKSHFKGHILVNPRQQELYKKVAA